MAHLFRLHLPGRLGIGLDVTLEVLQRREFAGTTVVRVAAGREVDLGDPAVAAIWVLPVR